MATYGLKKKPTLTEVITQIETEPNTIKYPDRTATLVRNSFELSQLDGEGMREMEQQQAQQMAEVAKENAIRNLAKNSDVAHADLSEAAKAATRSQSVQTMLKANKTQASQAVATTAEQGTQEAQQFDISQGDAPMDDEPPHVEDRRTQLLEQETRHYCAKGN